MAPNKRRSSSVSSRIITTKTESEVVKNSTSLLSTSTSSSSEQHHQAHHEFEFGGPTLGPIGIIVGLPLLTFIFANYCTSKGWPNFAISDITNDLTGFAKKITIDAINTWSLEVFLAYLAYFLFHVLLSLVVPGPVKLGAPLPDGTRLPYRLNGFRCLCIIVSIMVGIQLYEPFGPKRYTLEWILINYPKLAVAMTVFSFLLSFFLYAYSFVTGHPFNGKKILAAGGHTGYPLYDYFIGRELNPRVLYGQLDLKFFCELRPGLCMWFLINLACAFKQMNLPTNASGWVDPWMIIVIIFEGLYIVDSVWNEEAILTTMDITTDGFGFMLAFGDLAWVPVIYSLQARYLADSYSPLKTTMDVIVLLAILGTSILGMYIFRGANSQKDAFKANPNAPEFKDFKVIKTTTGSKLLASGWWGVARHINYFGDWIMSVAWSLPTGFATPITYFYPFYFAILLIHRDMRDEEKCAKKYGKSWDEYCKISKWRIVPYVY